VFVTLHNAGVSGRLVASLYLHRTFTDKTYQALLGTQQMIYSQCSFRAFLQRKAQRKLQRKAQRKLLCAKEKKEEMFLPQEKYNKTFLRMPY